MSEPIEVPEKLQVFMYGLIKEAQRDSFMNFLENWGVDHETEYFEISKWFKQFGINLDR